MTNLIRGIGPYVFAGAVCLLSSANLNAQAPDPHAAAGSVVPHVVHYSGIAINGQGKPVEGVAGLSFAIYKDQVGGVPLWMETQSVQADAKGSYSVQLGAAKLEGLPQELFSSGEARWLGIQVNGAPEQPRVLLLSVPYALAAADAQTLGGLPPSAFLQAGNSNPGAKLDVNGSALIHGPLNLPATASATASAGANSQQINLTTSVFNSTTAKPERETFRLQAEPVGNNTSAPAGKLNLLFGSGTPSETGLSISSNGVITFAPGQTFPSASTGGTVTKVGLSAPASDFAVTGSPVKHSGTLKLQWLVPPTPNNVSNAIVKRDASGNVQVNTVVASAVQVGAGGLSIFQGGVSSVSTANLPQTPAISGRALATGPGSTHGVNGFSSTDNGAGVFGNNNGANGAGVHGRSEVGGFGVLGQANGASGQGVWGESAGTANSVNGMGPDGVVGIAHSGAGSGVIGINNGGGIGVQGVASGTGLAGSFQGTVEINGNVVTPGSTVSIDHPLDPANKLLTHSSVESAEMLNLYNGNVTTDAQGRAVVQLPEWFEAMNRDFRYQLTVIGQFAQVIVAKRVANHSFTIQTDKPNIDVSWQVAGIRQDAWANAHRAPAEQMKPEKERGYYLHPELYGAGLEKSVEAIRNPGIVKLAKHY